MPILSILFALNIQADAENRGLQALDKGDYAQAEQIFSGLVSQDPKDYGALFNLALAETGLKKNDQATEHYRKVLSLKPGLYEAELNLGILELREQHAADALPLLQDAAKQKPSAAPPHRYLGDAYLTSGDAAAAEEQYKQAVAAN
ncbi:MAG: tetratricopeptide repeat protein, partial [Acidobacteriaceae bacterium]|nr:tetratricopeptide repeat protein [Acidobacteriaceae bacterium]